MTRTDNDTWDLTTGVGTTATGVAACRALATHSPNPLITDPYAERLVDAVGVDQYRRLAQGQPHNADPGVPDPTLLADAMGIRTRYFDDFFLDATQAGIRQAVILASGLDARPYRLPWPSGTTVFELDQPAVIEFKSRALSAQGATPTAALHAIGIDLRHDWPTALRTRGFDPGSPTAWIAEGLLGYLPPDAQNQLFDDVTALSAPGSRIAADWNPNPVTDVADLLFAGPRHPVPDYLAERGWRPDTTTAEAMFTLHRRAYRRDDTIMGLLGANYTTAELAG